MKTFGFLMLFSVFALFVEGCDYVLEDAQDDFEEDWNPYFGMDFSELHFDAADVTADEESGNRPIRYTHGTARVYDDLLLQFDQVEIKGTSGSNDVLKAWGCVEYLADGDPDGATAYYAQVYALVRGDPGVCRGGNGRCGRGGFHRPLPLLGDSLSRGQGKGRLFCRERGSGSYPRRSRESDCRKPVLLERGPERVGVD